MRQRPGPRRSLVWRLVALGARIRVEPQCPGAFGDHAAAGEEHRRCAPEEHDGIDALAARLSQ